jgi:hypothetical protein
MLSFLHQRRGRGSSSPCGVRDTGDDRCGKTETGVGNLDDQVGTFFLGMKMELEKCGYLELWQQTRETGNRQPWEKLIKMLLIWN